MSLFHDPGGALRPATLSLAGLAIATVAVVAIAVGPGRPAAAPASTPPSPSSSVAPPPADPTPVPTPVVTPKPTPVVTPKPPVSNPTDDPEDKPISVNLDTFDGHQVSIDIVDRTGSIVRAVTGHPGDNPSADGLAVANVDAKTLKLTWVDFPIDNQLTLFVDEVDGRLWLLLIQPPPTGTTDAVGMDRQLVLTFDRAVDASTVKTFIQEGMDT